MAFRRFSWLIKAPLLAAGLGFFGLPFAGCGGDEEAACPAGTISRDGKCYATCDEQVDCKGDPKLKCVAAPPQSPEGACFGTCTGNNECQAGQICTGATTIKGEAAQVCAPRSLLGLPPGKLNDACVQPGDRKSVV